MTADEKLKNLIANIFQMKPESIGDQTGPETIPNWDSLNSLMMFAAVEQEFKVKISSADMVAIQDYAGLKSVLKKLGVCIE